MKVTQHLWYEKDMEAAVRFYVSLIPNSKIEDSSAVMGDNPAGPAGSVKIMSFTLGDQNYMAIEAGPLDPFNHSFSIMVEPETQAELDRIWDALCEGGSIEQCGWVRDRWGLCWQVAPKRLRELMGSSDPAAVKRVTEKMLTMVKLDIAPLEDAAKG